MSTTRAAELVREGVAAAKAGELARARTALGEALTLDPDNANAWVWAAGVAQDPLAGLRALERALRLDPQNVQARAGLRAGRFEAGVAAAKAQRRAEARELLRQVCAEDPNHEAAWLWLAGATDDPAEATNCLEQALRINPNNPKARAGLSHFRDQTPTPWACPICRARADGKADPCPACRAVLDLGMADKALGNPDPDKAKIWEGAARLAALARSRPDFLTCYYLGMALLNLGRPDEAVPHFRTARQLRPRDVAFAAQLARLEQALLAAAPPTQRIKAEAQAAPQATRSVLVVDDNPTIRKLVGLTLQRAGFRVAEAQDGREALEVIAAQGNPDLIVLDVLMPDMDGYTLCRALRDNPTTAAVRVIMLSAKDGFLDRMRGRMAGCSHYLTKPFQPDALVKAVREFYPAVAG